MAEKIVVTGALGFIGFALCRRLLDQGFEVVGIDGMVDERLQDFYEEKLLWIGRNAQFTLINKRIEELDLKEYFKDAKAIYHLAAATSRDRKWQDLRETIEDNVEVTKMVVSACNEQTKIIYTSSTQVYGDRSGTITEKTPLNPITPYSLTKMAAESLIKSHCKGNSIPYVIFRLPTIYGPWQRTDMTYHRLICDVLSNSNNDIDNDRVTEDVLYIDDILDTLIEASIQDKCKNETFNLATGKANEWFLGRELINSQLRKQNIDERLQVIISNEKVVSELKFQVMTKLEAGLKQQKEHILKYKHLYVN